MLKCYYMNIACGCSYEQARDLCRVIPDDRIKKIATFKNEDRAVKYMLSSAFLQYGLSIALEIPIKEIVYQYGTFGKPMLSEGVVSEKVDFNLSHSGKYAVLAVSDGLVGIDIEGRKKNRITVAKRCFCEEEFEDILAAPSSEECDKRFLEYWTMKEAYVKRSGEGLHVPLNSFLIRRQKGSLSYVENENIYFASLFYEKEKYCVSVCSDKKDELNRIQECHAGFQKWMHEITIADMAG